MNSKLNSELLQFQVTCKLESIQKKVVKKFLLNSSNLTLIFIYLFQFYLSHTQLCAVKCSEMFQLSMNRINKNKCTKNICHFHICQFQ